MSAEIICNYRFKCDYCPIVVILDPYFGPAFGQMPVPNIPEGWLMSNHILACERCHKIGKYVNYQEPVMFSEKKSTKESTNAN